MNKRNLIIGGAVVLIAVLTIPLLNLVSATGSNMRAKSS
jgi:hypothetical protein